MDICFDETGERWDAFVARSPHRSVFVTAAFLRSLGTPFVLVTCTEGGRIIAGAPIMLTGAGEPINDLHRFTLYQGLLLEDAAKAPSHRRVRRELDVTEFFVRALLARFSRCCLAQSWRFGDLRAFLWHNYHEPERGQFHVTQFHTGVIDLTAYATFDDYLASIRQVRRQDWRKGHELDFRDIDDVGILDELHEKTYQRQEIARGPSDSRLLRGITSAALAGGYGRLCCAFVGDVPVSATLFLHDDRSAVYMFGANDPDFRNSPASRALLIRMIRDAHAQGLAEVDMMGMNSPARGDYKLSFNAEVHGYVTVRFAPPSRRGALSISARGTGHDSDGGEAV